MATPPPPRPRHLGFRMPAEWEPHAATWLAWPHNQDDWPGKFGPIPWINAEIVRLIAVGERVEIFVQHAKAATAARRVLKRGGVDLRQVTFHHQPTDRVWTRDSGPIFVRHGAGGPSELGVCDWKFNAWAKYKNWKRDDKLPAVVAKKLKLRSWQPMAPSPRGPRRVVLEGGSIDVDGHGNLLTTEECQLSKKQQRNPGLSREALEEVLRDHLGVEQILWLNRGIVGDDTHGHIDDIARFIREGTIVASVEPNKNDPNHEPLRENLERLKRMRDGKGEPFVIVELPLPAPVYFDGQRLPASYANFYIANAAVLVPVFNDRNDGLALRILGNLFLDRPVIPVYCRDLLWGLGTLHCMTQQQPAL